MQSILSFSVCPPFVITDSGYLRAKGANFKDHPVMKELERIKVYIRKLNEAEQVPSDRVCILRLF